MNRIGVIAANTNWKYSRDAPGRCQLGMAVHQRDAGLALLGGVPEDGPRVTDERADQRCTEAQLEPPQNPGDQDQGEGGEHHQHGVHGPLLLHQAAVEHGQGRDRHQPDQRGCCHLPGVIPGVQPARIGTHYASRAIGGLLAASVQRWLYPGRSIYLQGMCPMREFRPYYSVVTRTVTSAADVSLMYQGRSPGQGVYGPAGPRYGPQAPGFLSRHVPVTDAELALEINHPIVVLCWHTSPVSAYRRFGTRCRHWRHLSSGRYGKRLPDASTRSVRWQLTRTLVWTGARMRVTGGR